jgi:hypothetical protein
MPKDIILATCFVLGMAILIFTNPFIAAGVILVALSIMYA